MDSNVFDQDRAPEPMTLEYAKNLLGLCTRIELRDHAFSDREICWRRGDVEVAEGYFGGGTAQVFIHAEFSGGATFEGDDARVLSVRGTNVVIGRNDETGPDEYGGQ